MMVFAGAVAFFTASPHVEVVTVDDEGRRWIKCIICGRCRRLGAR